MSMTGFASAEGASEAAGWTWEARSVNGRGLDVRVRLPPGWDAAEIAVRRKLADRFTRGNVSLTLQIERSGGGVAWRVNEDQLRYYLDLAAALHRDHDITVPGADGLLGLKGVIEQIDEPAAAEGALADAVLASLDVLIERLETMRREEGARIGALVAGQLDAIAALVETIRGHAARAPEVVRTRLAGQVEALLGAAPVLTPERLHQEVALLATKADIQEEIDRLTAHVAAARDLLAGGGAIGRRLDFLTQEFNREANTICSKAIHHDITSAGLALKAVIDQMREQVQNIE